MGTRKHLPSPFFSPPVSCQRLLLVLSSESKGTFYRGQSPWKTEQRRKRQRMYLGNDGSKWYITSLYLQCFIFLVWLPKLSGESNSHCFESTHITEHSFPKGKDAAVSVGPPDLSKQDLPLSLLSTPRLHIIGDGWGDESFLTSLSDFRLSMSWVNLWEWNKLGS